MPLCAVIFGRDVSCRVENPQAVSEMQESLQAELGRRWRNAAAELLAFLLGAHEVHSNHRGESHGDE